jgi:hypothetical protein
MPEEKTLASLSADERLALVALIERVLLSERSGDDDEIEALDKVVAEIGEDVYASLVAGVDTEFEDDDRLEEFLETITNQDARELILGTVVELAITDGVRADEDDWIKWVSDAWHVPVRIEDSGIPE